MAHATTFGKVWQVTYIKQCLACRAVIDNRSQNMAIDSIVRLDQLPRQQPAVIAAIDWQAIAPQSARRLREMGFDEGVAIEVRHRSAWGGRGPLACQVGRMLIAIQHSHAIAITVRPASQ